MTNHNPSPHGKTGPTIDTRPNDGAFVAAVVVPVVVIATIWMLGTPTAAVAVASIAIGAATVKYDVVGRVVGETPPTIRGNGTDADDPTTPAGKPAQ